MTLLSEVRASSVLILIVESTFQYPQDVRGGAAPAHPVGDRRAHAAVRAHAGLQRVLCRHPGVLHAAAGADAGHDHVGRGAYV